MDHYTAIQWLVHWLLMCGLLHLVQPTYQWPVYHLHIIWCVVIEPILVLNLVRVRSSWLGIGTEPPADRSPIRRRIVWMRKRSYRITHKSHTRRKESRETEHSVHGTEAESPSISTCHVAARASGLWERDHRRHTWWASVFRPPWSICGVWMSV